jgi:hypothetical protein
VSDTTNGLSAQGSGFGHRAIANLHLQSNTAGTSVVIELLVERSGGRGFMLFDVGGYYNIQMRKWLDGIQWTLHQERTGTRDESTNPLVLAEPKPAARIFNGCLLLIVGFFALYFLGTFISALIGLLTGHLYLWGRGGMLAVHGIPARIVSGLILMGGAFVAWRVKRKS